NGGRMVGLLAGDYRAQLRVTSARVQLFTGDQRLADAPREKGPFGQVALFDPLPDEIVLEGTAEPSWFQSLVDRALADQRVEFDKKFAPEKQLPAWLFERPPGTRTLPKSVADYPGRALASAAALRPALAAMAKGDWQKARTAVDDAAAGDVPP